MKPRSEIDHSKIVKPFMRWVGGKQKMIGSLIDFLPPEDEYDQYVEPFLGAGSLFLACQFKNAHLNDLNAHLINAYSFIQSYPEELWDELALHKVQLEALGTPYYYMLRSNYNKHLEYTDLDQAARFIFLIHNNFRGLFRVNKKGEYNVPYGNQAKVKIPEKAHLTRISECLQDVKLTNLHYDAVIQDYGKRTLVYLDPPYPPTSKSANFTAYTIDRFNEEAQRRLAGYALELSGRKAKVMISISDTPLVRKIYALGWHFHRTELKRNLNPKTGPVKVGELILTNYDPGK